MPDIMMCDDDKCHLKNKCLRFMAIPSEYGQIYFAETPRKDYDCDYFCPIELGQRLNEKLNIQKNQP
jgi:hypothetical protein